MKRYPQYHKRKTKPLLAERQDAQERADIETHFQNFIAKCDELKIHLDNVHNFDESGFRIGCLRGQVVWTHADVQVVYILDPDNRELVTLLEYINSAGKVSCDPIIIMSGALFKEQHFDNNLFDGVLFSLSESGYTNDRLSFEWIKHFNLQTEKNKKGKYWLLIIDGHSSHLTNEFIDYCWAEDIISFLLPAHTTHLLQPLDIGIFQSYKHYHQESLEESIRYGGVDYKKMVFLAGLTKIRKHTFKHGTIKFAFRKAGLIPFSPIVVYDKIVEFSMPVRMEQGLTRLAGPDCGTGTGLWDWDRTVGPGPDCTLWLQKWESQFRAIWSL